MTILRCISPIDGSVFAEREALSLEAARAEIRRVRDAQAAWAARPLAERVQLVMAGVAAIGAQNDEIVPELARMMGRPVRYGGEFGGFNERASHMAQIAADSLADIEVGEDAQFKRYIRRVPHGVVFVVAPWNYPYMTAINTIAPALIGTDLLQQGIEAVQGALTDLGETGGRHVIGDKTRNSDLALWADILRNAPLVAGGSGLATSLAQCHMAGQPAQALAPPRAS